MHSWLQSDGEAAQIKFREVDHDPLSTLSYSPEVNVAWVDGWDELVTGI